MSSINRSLELEWLADFELLATTGNFSRAAQARNIAQPAFSRHIRALEEWAGTSLIDRTTHPVSLTAAGTALLPYFVEVRQQLEFGRSNALAAHEASNRKLQFAATHALSIAFFPKWLSALESEMDIGAIQVVSDSYQACEELMLQRKVQFLLCHGHATLRSRLAAPEFIHAVIDEDVLLPVSAPSSGGPSTLTLDDGTRSAIPLLAYSQESGLGQIMRCALPEILDDSFFRTTFTSHHAVLLKSLAMEGRGLAWLPASLIAEELKNKQLSIAEGSKWKIPVEICLYRQNELASDTAKSVWKLITGA